MNYSWIKKNASENDILMNWMLSNNVQDVREKVRDLAIMWQRKKRQKKWMSLWGGVRKRKIKLCAHIDLSDKDQPEQCFNLFSLLCTISAVAEPSTSIPSLGCVWRNYTKRWRARLMSWVLFQRSHLHYLNHLICADMLRSLRIRHMGVIAKAITITLAKGFE